MRVHVAFTPADTAAAPTGIVIDVLRATSTIAQALAAGYERVLCVAEIEQAQALRAELPESIVGGERDAIRIEGFDVGASPREFLEPRARTLILSTTNGTRTIVTAAERCDEVLLGSLLNLDAVVAAAPRAERGRGDPLCRLHGRVRAGRCLLRRPDRAAARRRADGRRCGGRGDRRGSIRPRSTVSTPEPTDRPGSRRTSPSAPARACSLQCRGSPACAGAAAEIVL